MRSTVAFFFIIVGVCFITPGCQKAQSKGTFTTAEKKAMVTKTEPPKEAKDAMAKMNTGMPTGKETSPWGKSDK